MPAVYLYYSSCTVLSAAFNYPFEFQWFFETDKAVCGDFSTFLEVVMTDVTIPR